MDFNNIDIDNIKIEKQEQFYSIKYNNSKLLIKIPRLKVPFGIETEYNNLILKLDLNTNESNNLKLLITNIENKINNILNINIKSQIRSDNILICKIPKIKNKITTLIKDNNNSYFNLYNITKNQLIEGCIYIDSIWEFQNKFYYKWNYKKIIII